MPVGDYGELGGSLPIAATLNSSYSTSLSLPSPYLFVPPAERKTISDVRRTFCLFVTFDLLFISLLWIIELNVSSRRRMFVSPAAAAVTGESDSGCFLSLTDLQLHQGEPEPRGHPLRLQVILL